jgi:hypothetical protein
MQSGVVSRGCGARQGSMLAQPMVARGGTHRALRRSIGAGRQGKPWTPCHGNRQGALILVT